MPWSGIHATRDLYRGRSVEIPYVQVRPMPHQWRCSMSSCHASRRGDTGCPVAPVLEGAARQRKGLTTENSLQRLLVNQGARRQLPRSARALRLRYAFFIRTVTAGLASHQIVDPGPHGVELGVGFPMNCGYCRRWGIAPALRTLPTDWGRHQIVVRCNMTPAPDDWQCAPAMQCSPLP